MRKLLFNAIIFAILYYGLKLKGLSFFSLGIISQLKLFVSFSREVMSNNQKNSIFFRNFPVIFS